MVAEKPYLWLSDHTGAYFSFGKQILIMCQSVSRLVVCLTLCNPMDCSPPGSSVHGDSPGKNTGVGCHFLLQGIIQPREWTWSSALQVDSLLYEPQGKHVCVLAQLWLTFCSPTDCSLLGSSAHGGEFQARLLEWGCYFLLQGIFGFFTTGTTWEAQ